jgi:hypothetical protein
LKEQAKNRDLQLEDVKRKVLIDQVSAGGNLALIESSDLGLLAKKWDGKLPSNVVLGSELLNYLNTRFRETIPGGSVRNTLVPNTPHVQP